MTEVAPINVATQVEKYTDVVAVVPARHHTAYNHFTNKLKGHRKSNKEINTKMKGLLATITIAKMLLILFGLLIIHQDVVDATKAMNNTCAYYSGYISNPTNCQGWGLCEGGVLKATGNCKKGMLYDSRKGICNYASKVECYTSPADICANTVDDTFVADPNNCNKYCFCSKKTLIGCKTCDNKQLFNPSQSQCVNSYECATNSPCRLVPNNQFVGLPGENCGKYLRCLDGSGISGSCATGLFFNGITGKCQNSNPCGTTAITPNALPPNKAICKTYSAKNGAIQYIQDGSTCYGYYTCENTEGPGLWRACPYTLQFDSKTQTCVQYYQTKCGFNRCGNINLKFMTDTSSPQCTKYFVCNNGQQSKTSTACPAGYTHFDEVQQSCSTINPTFPICN